MNTRIIELGKQFKELKRQHAEISNDLKVIATEWTEVENSLIEAMVEEGVKSVNLDGVGMFTVRTTNFLSVTADKKAGFFEYLQESGNGGLLKLDVHPATLKSFLSEHLQFLTQEKIAAGMDEMEAKNEALSTLESKGAGFFTKRDIAMKG